jgi:hypothetical protein
MLNGGNHGLNFLESLEPLLKISTFDESKRHIELVNLNKLGSFHFIH